MAAPVSTPEYPLGMNGCQLAVFTAFAAPMTKMRMATILISTITLLVPALSLAIPRTSTQVRIINTTKAERLNQLPV